MPDRAAVLTRVQPLASLAPADAFGGLDTGCARRGRAVIVGATRDVMDVARRVGTKGVPRRLVFKTSCWSILEMRRRSNAGRLRVRCECGIATVRRDSRIQHPCTARRHGCRRALSSVGRVFRPAIASRRRWAPTIPGRIAVLTCPGNIWLCSRSRAPLRPDSDVRMLATGWLTEMTARTRFETSVLWHRSRRRRNAAASLKTARPAASTAEQC